MNWLKFKYVFFFFFFLIVWKPHLWVMINAFCLFLEACGQLPGGSWSGRNLYLRCRQSRRLEHGNLWYIMMDLQQHFWKYIQIIAQTWVAVKPQWVSFSIRCVACGCRLEIEGSWAMMRRGKSSQLVSLHGIGILEFRAELCVVGESGQGKKTSEHPAAGNLFHVFFCFLKCFHKIL